MAEEFKSAQATEFERYEYGTDAVRDLRRRVEVLEGKSISVGELPIIELARKLAIISPTDQTGLAGASVAEGSIQDLAVTSRKAGLTTRHVWLPAGTAQQTLSSSTWTNITSLSYTMTPDTNSWLLTYAQLLFYAPDANWRSCYVRQDVTPTPVNAPSEMQGVSFVHSGGPNIATPLNIRLVELQGGGTYTVQMQGLIGGLAANVQREGLYTNMGGVLWGR